MSTPKATNALNSLGTFVQRTLYADLYPKDLPKPIDLWYDRPLYGKVNNLSNAIFLSEAALKQIKTSDKRMHMAVNFVTDAFSDFRRFFERSTKQAKIDINNSQFSDLEPKKAWTSVNALYQSYVTLLYENFNDVFVKDLNRDEKITNFDTFIPIFLEYLGVLLPLYPFTRTGFITSRFCSVDSSGLSVQIRDYDHSIDRVKYENFIKDKLFEFYVKAAEQHGLMIDKNAPWRLVADINSPAMIKYLQRYELDARDVLEKYFYESFKLDLETLKVYVLQFYNSYVSGNTMLRKPEISCKNELFVSRIKRPFQNIEALPIQFWIRLYCFIRILETNTITEQSNFEYLVKNSIEIYDKLGSVSCLEYINRHVSKVLLFSLKEIADNDLKDVIKLADKNRKYMNIMF